MTNRLVMLGRLTRDPEARAVGSGKVTKFSLATTGERKKNQQSGKWEEVPCFIDCEVWNRGEHGKQADTAEQYLTKGQQVYAEAHLKTDSWTGQDGVKKSRMIAVIDNFQMVGAKKESNGDNWQAEPRKQAERSNVTPNFAPDEEPESIPF